MNKSKIKSRLEKVVNSVNVDKFIFYSLTSMAVGLDAAVGYGTYLHIVHPEEVNMYNDYLGVTGDSLWLIFPALYANVFSAVVGYNIYFKKKVK